MGPLCEQHTHNSMPRLKKKTRILSCLPNNLSSNSLRSDLWEIFPEVIG